MAFNMIECLKQGDVEFVYSLTRYDEENLIEWVRNDKDRINIINGFLDKLKDDRVLFCLNIIYDIEEYKEEALELLEKRGYIFLTSEKIKNILYKTSWGKEFVLKNLDKLISYDDKTIYVIFKYILNDLKNNKDLIDLLYLHKDLHTRYLFMEYLVMNNPKLITEVYDDITKYLTSYTHQEFEQMTFLPELMKVEDISDLAVKFLYINDREKWLSLKQYILNNYEDNGLAKLLLYNKYENDVQKEKFKEEFITDSNRLFETSRDYRFQIYQNYSKYLSDELIKDFCNKIEIFRINASEGYHNVISSIYFYGLGNILEKCIDKYLSLSKDKSCEYLTSGSMSSCFRVGDYVFKLCRQKWSYEDVICPDLYLILKNIEEHFVRNENGIVNAGIEIQKYLTRNARNVKFEYFEKFKEELDRLGYFSTDTLINGSRGDNCMLLDSYKDADCHNPEMLPDWFKEVPLVLVDRDRIYEKGRCYIKQLREGY